MVVGSLLIGSTRARADSVSPARALLGRVDQAGAASRDGAEALLEHAEP
jgi:hypothetical protein